MRGVVTSPVVTPALSHAMPTAASEAVCKRCGASGVVQAVWCTRCGVMVMRQGGASRARLRAQCARDGGERQQQSEKR